MRNVLLALMGFVLLFPTPVKAQFEELVKTRIHDGLAAKLVKQYPHRNCPCNSCEMTYDKRMKITRTRSEGDILKVWGQAKVVYTSRYQGAGAQTISFYAEVKKSDGQVFLTMLKWQSGTCMKLKPLM